jgi:uncharacterized protein (TIGR02679 family)
VTAAGQPCQYCDGGCAGADLTPLLAEDLSWLWQKVAAAADRRGDVHLSTGHLEVRASANPAERAAAVGLLGGRPLAPNQARRVNLTDLTDRLRRRGRDLTPGVVAAHATCRPLAVKARVSAAREIEEQQLRQQLDAAFVTTVDRLPATVGDNVDIEALWAKLRRARWVARLLATGNPADVLARVLSVVRALPSDGTRVDRRYLADAVLDDPHGLDDDQRVASLVLGLLTCAGRAPAGVRPRNAWDAVGVDYDDLTGGLLVVGIYPSGWQLPAGAVLTLPPRELRRCCWPAAPTGAPWVFVTENPSVLGAAEERTEATVTPRVVCTVGTPSAGEIEALRRLSEAGWRIHVRADFDAAGLAHVRALLAGIPGAVPWRMSAADYRMSVRRSPEAPGLDVGKLGASPWDPALAETMASCGIAAFEESLTDELVGDVLGPRP